MEQTLFLAELMGLFSLIMGFSMLLRRKMVMGVFDEMANGRLTLYLIGVLEVILGLALVLKHNIWTEGSLAFTISILGWLILAEGVLYVSLPERITRKMLVFAERSRAYFVIALFYLVLGGYLVYAGF
ncbi:MAG: hypothetical protein Q7S15_02125 [bacterium]|nr:hypothetical protein [bacterium]